MVAIGSSTARERRRMRGGLVDAAGWTTVGGIGGRNGQHRGSGSGVALEEWRWTGGLAKLRKERRCWETAGGSSWEPLARRRARDAAEAIRRLSSQLSPTSPSAYTSTVSQSNLSAILMCFCLVSKSNLLCMRMERTSSASSGRDSKAASTDVSTRSLNACWRARSGFFSTAGAGRSTVFFFFSWPTVVVKETVASTA